MSKIKKIAVFCGASSGSDPIYTAAAKDLGAWLAVKKIALVYGGGGVGLMGTLAKSVLANGGLVQGIMPKNLYARGASLSGLTDLTITADMAQRKKQMLAQADGCIALPGGPGTLEEISEAYSWTRVGDFHGACCFDNVAGYYDGLASFFDHMTQQGFLTEADRAKLLFATDLDSILTFMENYTDPKLRQYPQAERRN